MLEKIKEWIENNKLINIVSDPLIRKNTIKEGVCQLFSKRLMYKIKQLVLNCGLYNHRS